jgi:hypothetical protein
VLDGLVKGGGMVNSGFVGVAIGLILVYFLLSLLVSGINEVIEAFWQRRARYLEVGVWDLMGPLTAKFYDHFLIRALHPGRGRPPRVKGVRTGDLWAPTDNVVNGAAEGSTPAATNEETEEEKEKKNRPSYIPARAFSRAALDIVLTAEQLATIELTTGMSASATGDIEIGVASVAAFPSARKFRVKIDGEEFIVKGPGPGKSSWIVNRTDPSKAAGHAARAQISLVAEAAPDADALFDQLAATVAMADLPHSLKDPLLAFLKTSNRDLDRWRAQVEGWFDDKMDRLSGWYKRRTKWILFAIGLVLVASLNADTLSFGRTLWKDATLRSNVTAQAQTISKTPPDCTKQASTSGNPVACSVSLFDSVKGLDIPLGWTTKHGDPRLPSRPGDWGLRILGLLLTAIALSLGAPFWFDLLNKIVNFRTTGPPPAPAPSKDSGA